MTIKEVTSEGLRLLVPAIERLAAAEKLVARKRAASLLLEALRNEGIK